MAVRPPRSSIAFGATLLFAAALVACYPPVPAGEDFSTRWERTLSGPTDEDDIDGVAVAADGSAYVTGKFEGTATLGGATLTSAGRADIPFARFDSLGSARWVARFGGPGEDNLFDVDAVPAGGAVGTGLFSETVAFGVTTLTSSGPVDCVVVSVDGAGAVRWAKQLGGPYRDGCNEVSVAADGSIVTSIDTEGGWTPPGAAPIPRLGASDTLLVRLRPDGTTDWMRHVGGGGDQRGKALAVAPDGSITFGGDSVGALDVAGMPVAVPGAGRDAWLSRWSPTGTRQWVETWGGPDDDLAKGVVDDGSSVSVVGPFTGTVDLGGTSLSAGAAPDLAVARFTVGGALQWATAVTADTALAGAEIAAAADGGILFGSMATPGIRFRSATGDDVPLDVHNGGTAWLAHYRPDGSVGFAATIPGTAYGRVGEIARARERVYLDIVLHGAANTVNGTPIAVQGKDSSLWSLDLA